MKRALAVGFVLWPVATGILRFAPARLLDPSRPVAFIALCGASFALLFVVFRSFVARPAGGVAALCAGVALVLPLICCGGALTGLISRLSQP